MPQINRHSAARVLLLAPIVAVSALHGCKKEPPPPPPPPPPVRRPPPPEPVSVDTLLQAMKADARVQFPASSAPTDEGLARAVITFADAFAKGDAAKLKPMLDPLGKQVLDQLSASGDWDESTGKKIEAVRVSRLSGSDPASLRLAIQEPGEAYALAWSVRAVDGNYIFSGAPIANMRFPRASDFDSANVGTGLESGPAPTAPVDNPSSKPDSSDQTPPKDEAPAPADGPKKRSTPNGPITIPQPKPGGG